MKIATFVLSSFITCMFVGCKSTGSNGDGDAALESSKGSNSGAEQSKQLSSTDSNALYNMLLKEAITPAHHGIETSIDLTAVNCSAHVDDQDFSDYKCTVESNKKPIKLSDNGAKKTFLLLKKAGATSHQTSSKITFTSSAINCSRISEFNAPTTCFINVPQ